MLTPKGLHLREQAAWEREGRASNEERLTNGVSGSVSLRATVRALRAMYPIDSSLSPARVSNALSLSEVWDDAMWRRHTGKWRHLVHIGMLRRATVTAAIWPLMVLVVGWALVVRALDLGRLPLAPLTLSASSIGLLLVFRTNQAAARASEARRLLGLVKRRAADLATYLALEPARDDGDRLVDVGARYCAFLIWAFKGAVRPGDAATRAAYLSLIPDEERDWVRAHQGGGPDDIVTPATCALRLRYVFRDLGAERSRDDSRAERAIADVAGSYGGCSRIYTTPIPPHYLRHISRTLVAWLLMLPFATSHLHDSAGALACSTGLVAFLLIGIDEIGSQIEEPFGVLPLHELALATSAAVASVVDGPRPPGSGGGRGGKPALV